MSGFSLPQYAKVAAFLFIVSALSSFAEARTWKDSTGKYAVEAELVEMTEDVVVLKKADNQEVRVPLARLSATDRRYVARQQAHKRPRALPATVDLRPTFLRWKLAPKRQGKRNTCSVCVTTSAFEYAASRRLDRGVPLSVEYLNWACNRVIKNETKDRGQFFHDLLKGFDAHGLCEERHMPYQARFTNPQPTASAMENAKEMTALGFKVHLIKPWSKEAGLTREQFSQTKSVLANGWPVSAGSHHSLLLVGYGDDARSPGGGAFIVADSGKGAFDTRTYESIATSVFDVFWVEVSLERKP